MDTLPPHASNGNPQKHKVYRFVDPRDHITFYVGITLNLYERFKQHLRCDGTNVQKDTKIQEILDAGFLPIMETIEQVDTWEQALERELYWIQHYLSLGVLITNLAGVSIKSPKLVQEKRSDVEAPKFGPYDLKLLTFKPIGSNQEVDVWHALPSDFHAYVQQFTKVSNVNASVWALNDRLNLINLVWTVCQKHEYPFPFDVKGA